jgi:hypothetical protein
MTGPSYEALLAAGRRSKAGIEPAGGTGKTGGPTGVRAGAVRFWSTSYPKALAFPRTREKAFEKIYRASLHVLRYWPDDFDFYSLPDPIDLSPVNGYRFSKPRDIPAIDRPRPPGKDLLAWLLEIGEQLPEEPQ